MTCIKAGIFGMGLLEYVNVRQFMTSSSGTFDFHLWNGSIGGHFESYIFEWVGSRQTSKRVGIWQNIAYCGVLIKLGF